MPKITMLLWNCIGDPQILNNSLFKQRKLYRSGNKALRFLVFYVIGKKEKQKKSLFRKLGKPFSFEHLLKKQGAFNIPIGFYMVGMCHNSEH